MRFPACLAFCWLTVTVQRSDGNVPNGTYCAYVENKVTTNGETGEPVIENSVSNEASVIKCRGDKEFCYTLWYIDPHDKMHHTVFMQGCWDNPDSKDCLPEPGCVARSPLNHANIRNNTRFCCCRGNLCNVNVTDNVNFTAYEILSRQQAALDASLHGVDAGYESRAIATALVSVIVVAVVVIVVFTSVRVYLMRRHSDPDATDEAGTDSSAAFLAGCDSVSAASRSTGPDLDGLKIDQLISHGRYGDVYRGLLGASEVAVKVLTAAQCRCYANERDVLSLPLMRHPGVVEFLGCREDWLPGGVGTQLMIVMSYERLGCLVEYLKNNTVDWTTACRMMHSLAAGLAHLHTELTDGGDVLKPTVVHRDVNSRNVLVKPDLTLCLCDFGFAMKIATSRLAQSNDEHSSLADVGTLRYMAPEVLEGSVNLYDCLMALTQVDVYALGLVFWEIGTRCHDLYQGLPTPDYRLPFEAEVGAHPSFEEMQVAVARNKLRPAFPDMWKNTNLAIKALKQTVEECWDHDAEARISAVCVEERTREMSSLWEMRFKGLTPTTTTLLNDLEEKAAIQHNATLSSCPIITEDDDISVSSSANVIPPPTQLLKPDCNVELEKSGVVAPPLAARHAQNPTVERNTHRSSSEELAIDGNTLIPRRAGAADHSTADTAVAASQPDASQSRRLSALRPDQLHRISYVQNVVDSVAPAGLGGTGPKRQNVELQARRPCELGCEEDIVKAGVSASDGDSSLNAAAAAAGDNLGYESSLSPCNEMAAAPTSCLV